MEEGDVVEEAPAPAPELKWHQKILNRVLCRSGEPAPPPPVLEEGEEPAREEWGNRCTFFISTLGMSVGLGQVWRFPVLAYKLGGGSFLVMYSIMIMMIGNSLFFFEISNGQYSGKNPLKCFDKVPILQGIGYAMISYAYFFCVYYNHMVSYGIYYFLSSFTSKLPWRFCPDDPDPSDPVRCFPASRPGEDGIICGMELVTYNTTSICASDADFTALNAKCCTAMGDDCENNSAFTKDFICGPREYPSSYFWSHTVNKKYRESQEDFGYLGEMNFKLLGTSFVAWLLNYISLYKGLASMGLIMYIMVPLPYVVLTIMFCVSVAQDGAGYGLKQIFTPVGASFLDINIWRVATEQAFYSLGVAMGPLVTFGSYSKFNSPCHIDGTLICVCVILTSILCSLVVFSVLGFLAESTGRPFDKVVEVGPGLVFIVYPESLELLPGNVFFSILFYLMIINLGSSTVSGIIETVNSVIYDLYPDSRRYKYIVNFVVLLSCFLLGLPITLRGGLNVYDAFDTFSAGLTLIPICALELIAIIYIYGIALLCEDIAFMIGFYPNRYYRYQWLIGPWLLICIFIYGITLMEVPDWKTWTFVLGWILFLCVMGPIPVTLVYQCIKYQRLGDIKMVLKPVEDHGPPTARLRYFRSLFVSEPLVF